MQKTTSSHCEMCFDEVMDHLYRVSYTGKIASGQQTAQPSWMQGILVVLMTVSAKTRGSSAGYFEVGSCRVTV
jgi:hypothetical protein